ncbi:MAG: TIGR00297 family protein [Candidatus Methanoperedens sp.]|nr:TIGR00297 family protein [Candidatus Methanoperedens sp.]
MMKLTQEYKTQCIYIFTGLIILFFPFLPSYFFMLVFFCAALFISRVRPGTTVFQTLARESDIRKGRLKGLTYLFLVIGSLFLISSIVGPSKFPIFIIGGALAITTFGDGVSDIINIHERKKSSEKVYSAISSVVFLISGVIFTYLACAWILAWKGEIIPNELIFFLAVIGAVTGALLESMTYNEDNIVIPFGSAMSMWLFFTFSYGYLVEWVYFLQVIIFAFVLGYLAYRMRIADISAMLSATLLGIVIIISTDVWWYLMLLAFFLLGGLFTRYKYDFKKSRGIAESKGGVRGYKNVFSNSLAALVLAVAFKVFPDHSILLLPAYLGSIATATGDTLASEIGQTWKGEPRMITTLKKVKPGTDGGVTVLGECAAFAGSGAIALLSLMFIKNDISLALIVLAGGFIGTNIDSVLGATLQQKGYLSNNGVNLFATISGAIITALIYSSLGS